MSRPNPAREPSSGAILLPAAERARVLRSPSVLGSAPDADVVIDDASIAGRHAVLMLDEDDGTQWKIVDLDSPHGTFVDGARVAGERVLTGRHELMLGRHRVAVVVARTVRLNEDALTIARGETSVALEALELAFVRVLAVQQVMDATRPEASRGFVKSTELAHLVPGAADLATPMVRQVARRLERKLAALGEPPVLETCERRGYRLRARLVVEGE